MGSMFSIECNQPSSQYRVAVLPDFDSGSLYIGVCFLRHRSGPPTDTWQMCNPACLADWGPRGQTEHQTDLILSTHT